MGFGRCGNRNWHAQDGTIVSYDINADGCVTMRHRRYMSKVMNSNEETESDAEGTPV